MAVRAAFERLWESLHRLRATVLALRLAVVEDRPAGIGVHPVQATGDGIEDLLGLVQESLDAAADGLDAATPPLDGQRAGRALAGTQRIFDEIGRRSSSLFAYSRLSQLARAAYERGGEWEPWVASVLESLEDYPRPMWDAHSAFLKCWEDLAEWTAHPPSNQGPDVVATEPIG